MAQYLYVDNRDGFGPRDFTKFLMDRDQFFSHQKNRPQLFDFMVTQTGDEAVTPYSELVRLDTGCIGYWRLGETGGTVAADFSGNGKTGTYVNTPTLGVAGALSDGSFAAQFNGTDEYVSTPLAFPATFTVEMFAWRTTSSSDDALWSGSDAANSPMLRLSSGSNDVAFWSDASTAQQTWAGAWPGNGQWVHVALTYTNSTQVAELYINGNSLGTKTLASPLDAAPGTFYAAMRGTGTNPFDGKLGEVAFYNRVLSAADVQAHYVARTLGVQTQTEWVVPKRGAFVKFYDDRWDSRHTAVENGVLFTGYVTEDPDPIFLGVKGGEKVWAYRVNCTSEEFLANSKKMPPKTYVNQTRGEIIKDLLREMFKNSTTFPYNLDGIMDGGTEKIFQVDTNQTLAELVEAFAAADGYTYWIIDSYVYYAPEDVVTSYTDPAYSLVIDELDPRFNPDGLDMNRVSRDIVNDVTVFGEDEATDVVREHFVSDGYQGAHNLAFDPFGLEASALIEDDFTADIDTQIWQEEDTGADYIQAFDGALNITGGPGTPAASAARTVYLLARRPLEVSGVINFRDGEIYFPPSPTGSGYIGGLYLNPSLATDQIWNAWYLDATARTISAIRPGGVTVASYTFVPTRHYILRRTVQVDRQVSTQSFTQPSTGEGYSISNEDVPVRTWLSWTIDEVNNDDPSNVFTTSTLLGQYEATLTVPAFLLYAAVVPNDCHFVANYLSVSKPQQAVLRVDGREQPLGSYLDGGRATLQSDNGKGKLAWYQIPGPPTSLVSYPNTVMGETTKAVPGEGCVGYWRLGETSGTTARDSSGQNHNGTSTNVTLGATGAIASDTDAAYTFNGTNSFITGAAFPTAFAGAGTFEAWFKTTSADNNTIYSTRNSVGSGEFFAVYNGQILWGSDFAGAFTSVRNGLNDGRWHHVVVSFINGGGSNCWLYIDGVLDTNTAVPRFPPLNPWYIGKDVFADTVIPGSGYFNGQIDEVAIYYNTALTAAQALNHYRTGLAANTSVITVPKAGSRIALTYYRKQKSRARVKSLESITTERERYRDDGIRQRIMRAEDIQPAPRTSQECLALAQAVLYDSAVPRYEGTYSFDTLEGHETELLFWPRPGDLVRCTLDLPDGDELDQLLSIQNVESEFLGEGAYRIKLGFGPINRFDIVVRNLILQRKSSLTDPVIQDDDTDTLEALADGYPYPADVVDCEVDWSTISATQFTVNLAQAGIPADVVNYEVREDDTGWGQPNYVARFRATSRTFTRTKRDLQYYIRPYNADGLYSVKSAFVRVVAPVANTYAVSGVKGDINRTRIRVIVPIPRDPDYAGITLQEGSAAGAVVFKGNGDINELMATGVTVLLSIGEMTIDIPNLSGLTSYTAHVNTYNLLGLSGTAQTVTISTASDGAWAPVSASLTANNGAAWTTLSSDISYTRATDSMTLSIKVTNSSLSGGPPTILSVALPSGFTATRAMKTTCALRDNGVRVSGTLEVATGGTVVQIKRLDNAAFSSPVSGTVDVEGQIQFEAIN